MQHLRLFALLTLPIFLLIGCGEAEAPAEQGRWGRGGPTATPAVEVIQARYGALPLEERLSGTVKAENQVVIYSEISAPITRVTVQNGDRVKAGAPLVYLDNGIVREQLRQAEAGLQVSHAEAQRAEAQVQELKARLARTRQLADKQFQSAQELEVLEAQVAQAEASHAQALGRVAQAEAAVAGQKQALRRTVVRAPISGYVGQRNAEIGMRADPGTPLFMMGNFDKVRVHVSVSDEMISLVQEGQTALITSETLGDEVIQAKVSRISPFLEAGSYSAEAQIDVPNTDRRLRAGMFVTVDVLYGESEQATLVPISALYENLNTGRMGVFVATSLGTEIPVQEPETFEKDDPPALIEPTPMAFREIEVIARGRGVAGVSGVNFGEWVVSVGHNLLSSPTQEAVAARVRPVPWERVASLQELQDQDLLRQFMEKQQRMSKQRFNGEGSLAGTTEQKPEAEGTPPAQPAGTTTSGAAE